jgi:hypothetical protein
MKILLDECVPRKLKYSLADHECHTVPEAGLAGNTVQFGGSLVVESCPNLAGNYQAASASFGIKTSCLR